MSESHYSPGRFHFMDIKYGSCIVISTPNNTAVVVGQRMEMECRTSNGSIVREWKRERHLGKGMDYLFLNWDTAPRDTNSQFPQFGVDADGSGSGVLYSNSTEIGDAGIYSCMVQVMPNAKILQYSAHLIVLESTPVCETNLTAGENALITNIWIQCSVRFKGEWWPFVEWKHHDGNQARRGTILSDGVSTVTVNNSTTISTLTSAIYSTKGMSSVSIKIYFGRPNGRTSVNATNTPSYEYTWIKCFVAELSEGVQSTRLITTCSEVARMNTPTIPSFANISAARENGKYPLLLWLVATMATIIVIMAITAIVCFFRTRSSKAKVKLRVSSSSESHGNLESLQHGDQSPRAISDHYDTIDELNIVDTSESPIIFLPQRTGFLPTPGYSGLEAEVDILPPSVYCRMNSSDPIDKESESGKRSVLTHVGLPPRVETEACLAKGDLQSEDNETIPNKEGSDTYLAPIDDNEDIHSAVADPSYIELFE